MALSATQGHTPFSAAQLACNEKYRLVMSFAANFIDAAIVYANAIVVGFTHKM